MMNPKFPKSEKFLPDEIQADIFSRLPTKAAGSCKCLSKKWNKYISSPNFIKLHLINRPRQENLIILGDDSSLRLLTPPIKNLDLYPGDQNWKSLPGSLNAMSKTLELQNAFSRRHKVGHVYWKEIVGCCNGLVLLLNEQKGMSLVNPIIKQMVHIPNPPPIKKNRACNLKHGFGCDSSNSDGKIVVLDNRIGNNTDVHLYSVETGLWRQLDVSPYHHNSHRSDFGAFVNGALHWIVSSKIPPRKPIIAAFDLGREVFFEIPTPSKDKLAREPSFVIPEFSRANEEPALFCDLVVLKGCLCLVNTRTRSRFIDLWIMVDYGVSDSWIKLRVDRRNGYIYDVRPLCVLKNEQMLWLSDSFGFFISDLENRRTREMVIDGNTDSVRHSYVDGCIFEESLVPPMGIQGAT